MVCPRCGAEIKPEQRYCMKCGALNYEHPDNQQMRQYITEEEFEDANQQYQKNVNNSSQTIEIGGKVVSEVSEGDRKTTYVDTRAMVVLLFVFSILLGVLYYFLFSFSFTMVFSLCLIFFVLSCLFLVFMSLYMKGGYSAIIPFIPFYGQYALADIALGNGWLFFILFIPIFGLLYILYKIGKVFGKSGWLTMLLPFIMLPIIAFSDRAIYTGRGKKYKLYVEKGKKRNTKIPAFLCSIIIFLLFLGFTQTSFSKDVASYFVTVDINRVMRSIENDVYDGFYFCRGDALATVDGNYYISVPNLSKIQTYPIPIRSSLNGKKLSGYVNVQVSKKKSTYRFWFTDGENVFSSDSRSMSSTIPEDAIMCKKES